MESNETFREKAKSKLYKNAAYCLEQILEAALHKTTAIRPLTFHLTNHPSKMHKTCLNASTLSGHWVSSRGPTKRDEQWVWREREREREAKESVRLVRFDNDDDLRVISAEEKNAAS